MELVTESGLRADGRRAGELRGLEARLGVDEACDGSALLRHGGTVVLARVFGPQELSPRLRSKAPQDSAVVDCHFVNTTVGADERMSWASTDKKNTEMKLRLHQTLSAVVQLNLFPKSQIDVCVEVLEEDGGQLCVCVNACVLALLDAGIPVCEYAVGCTASVVKDVTLVDVSSLEESQGGPVLSLVIFPLSGKIVHVDMSQRFHVDHLSSVMKMAKKGCKDIYTILDQAVRRHLNHMGAAYQWGKEGAVHSTN